MKYCCCAKTLTYWTLTLLSSCQECHRCHGWQLTVTVSLTKCQQWRITRECHGWQLTVTVSLTKCQQWRLTGTMNSVKLDRVTRTMHWQWVWGTQGAWWTTRKWKSRRRRSWRREERWWRNSHSVDCWWKTTHNDTAHRSSWKQKTCHRVVRTSIWLISYSGELCNKPCIIKTSEILIIWSASCYTAWSK